MAASSCNTDSGCSSCSSNSSCSTNEQEKHTEELLKKRLKSIKHRIMVMSGKGGVGKSTVTVNLASALVQLGYKVGIIDADIHGPNIPKMLGINERGANSGPNGIIPYEPIENLYVMSIGVLINDDDDAIIWRSPLKHSVIQQFLAEVDWGELDFLFFDLPPGTGDEPLSVSHILKDIDGSVIVTTPQEVALLDSRKSVTFSRKLNIPVLGIIENMSGFVCPKCGEKIDIFKVGGGEKAAKELKVPFLGKIPIDPEVVTQGDSGKPYLFEKPKSEVTNSFLSIARDVVKQIIK
ncbi:MAG: Mrp/NBP35 family ATP-binding protein [Calditerrivibrio sp.]|nr:Mrp/NBP35 family ATP-binding protein [Calditerrivibrio sp.]MCA1932593.1 Mrp/NBP35 family ATP-binding protein [Calditerrivibrio sp.]MCA1980320.1 Mrp/NBP35 family ATP-binding protein [Calditerrivibrio sp.]